MNSSNVMRLVRKINRARRSSWEACARFGRRWFEYLPSVPMDGYEIYLRWPGERVPPPSSGPDWREGQSDWELAA